MSDILQTIVGFCAIEFLYGWLRDGLDEATYALNPGFYESVVDGVTSGATIYDLASFAVLAFAVVLVTRMLHRRGAATLIGRRDLVVGDFGRALLGGLVLFAVLEAVFPFWGAGEAVMMPVGPWLMVLPVALLALFVQCAAEELFYRGYLQQQVAARFPRAWVWLVLPNIAFASVHWFNGVDMNDSLRYVVWAFVFGVAASDLVARSGSLGAAVGFHLANNIFAFLVVGEEGAGGSGLALFLYPYDATVQGFSPAFDDMTAMQTLGMDLGILVLVWLSVRVAIRR